jgi:hypothetical protein
MYVESCRTSKNDPYDGEEDSSDGKTKATTTLVLAGLSTRDHLDLT